MTKLLLLLATTTIAARADLILTLGNTGGYTVHNGDTITFPYTLQNTGNTWAVINASWLSAQIPMPYDDYIGAAFVVIKPRQTVSSPADFAQRLGLGTAFVPLNTNGAGGSGKIEGDLVVSYDTYTFDPLSSFFDPFTDTGEIGLQATTSIAIYLAPIVGFLPGEGDTTGSTAPEPGSLFVCATAGAALIVRRRRNGIRN